MSSKLQKDFLEYFKDQRVVTTKEIYNWYCAIKSNPENLPYRSAIHYLIINPLLHKGLIQKASGGQYILAAADPTEALQEESKNHDIPVLTEASEQEDRENYIKSKTN